MCVPRLQVAGSKQGNLGRPPCVDIGEQRQKRNLEQRCRLNLPRRPSAGAGTVGEALIGCVACRDSRPHIRSVGLPRKLRLLARKEEGVGSANGSMSLRPVRHHPPEPYNKPDPQPPPCMVSSPANHNPIHSPNHKCACRSKHYIGIPVKRASADPQFEKLTDQSIR